jgi:hypothetical protein
VRCPRRAGIPGPPRECAPGDRGAKLPSRMIAPR